MRKNIKQLLGIKIIVFFYFFNQFAMAHVNRSHSALNLIGARIIVLSEINNPPYGDAYYIVPSHPQKKLSKSEFRQYKRDFLLKNKVGKKFIYASVFLSSRDNISIPIDVNLRSKTVSKIERAYNWDEISFQSGELIIGSDDLGTITFYDDKTKKDINTSVSLYFHFRKLQIVEREDYDSDKKEKVLEIERVPDNYTVGEVQDLLKDIIYIDLDSIPSISIGGSR